jgi:hypothetical protein
MLRMSQALQRIKGATAEWIDAPLIHSLTRTLRLGSRRRRLTPVVTTHLFLRQIREGNTSVPELRRLAKLSFADSSSCEARQLKKRRAKPYDLMNRPRAVLRDRLLHQTSPPQEDEA